MDIVNNSAGMRLHVQSLPTPPPTFAEIQQSLQDSIKSCKPFELKYISADVLDAILTTQLPNGWLPLHFATREGNLSMVNALLEVGADPLQLDQDGCSAFYYSALDNRIPEFTTMARTLLPPVYLQKYTDDQLKERIDPKFNNSMVILKKNFTAMAGLLGSVKGYAIDGWYSHSVTKNVFAALVKDQRQEELDELLIHTECSEQEIADIINTPDANGNSPMHCAAWTKNSKMINTLIEAGGDIGLQNRFGLAPAYLLARSAANPLMNPDTSDTLFIASPFLQWAEQSGIVAMAPIVAAGETGYRFFNWIRNPQAKIDDAIALSVVGAIAYTYACIEKPAGIMGQAQMALTTAYTADALYRATVRMRSNWQHAPYQKKDALWNTVMTVARTGLAIFVMQSFLSEFNKDYAIAKHCSQEGTDIECIVYAPGAPSCFNILPTVASEKQCMFERLKIYEMDKYGNFRHPENTMLGVFQNFLDEPAKFHAKAFAETCQSGSDFADQDACRLANIRKLTEATCAVGQKAKDCFLARTKLCYSNITPQFSRDTCFSWLNKWYDEGRTIHKNNGYVDGLLDGCSRLPDEKLVEIAQSDDILRFIDPRLSQNCYEDAAVILGKPWSELNEPLAKKLFRKFGKYHPDKMGEISKEIFITINNAKDAVLAEFQRLGETVKSSTYQDEVATEAPEWVPNITDEDLAGSGGLE